jgi:hypothetical protein
MRNALLLTLVLATGTAQAASLTCPTGVNMWDLRGFEYRDAKTAVATMMDRSRYQVSFVSTCGYTRLHPQLAFNQTSSGRCLARGNLLRAYDGSGCIVRQVTELAPAR